MQDSPARNPLSDWQVFGLPGFGSLQIRTSPSWIAAVQQQAAIPLPTVAFRETPTGEARLIVTVSPLDANGTPSAEQLWASLQQLFEQLRGQVREEKPEPCRITTSAGQGYFFTITDRAPKPGEFLFMTSGQVPAGGVMLSFTILTNPQEQMLFARALATIRSAVHHPEGGAAPDIDEAASNAPPETPQQVLANFLDMDLNSEASLFVQSHPDLLRDPVLQHLRQMSDSTPPGIDHNRFLGALMTLRAARTLGVASVFAPMQLIVPINLVCFTADMLAKRRGTTPLDRATYETVLQTMADAIDPFSRVVLQMLLAVELMPLVDGPNGQELLEKTIGHLQAAQIDCTREQDVFLRATIASQLSKLYLNRAHDERAGNLEAAVEYAESALRDLDASGFVEDWIVAKKRLGLASAKRVHGYHADNVEYAIECFQRARSFCPENSPELWGLRNNLGLALLEREVGDKYENIKSAIAHFAAALPLAEERFQPGIQTNLGNAWRQLAATDVEAMEKTIACYNDAALSYQHVNDLWNWAGVKHNLGSAYLERELGTRPDNLANALRCLTDALTVRTLEYPRQHRSTQILLGGLHLVSGRWSEATASFTAAIKADDIIDATTDTLDAMQSESQSMHSAYADAAYCLLRLGRWDEAFLTLEKGNARTLGRGFEAVVADPLNGASTPAGENNLTPAQLLEVNLNALALSKTYAAQQSPDDRANLQSQSATIRAELPALVAKVREARAAAAAVDPALRLKQYLAAIRTDGVIVAPIVTKAGSAAFVIRGGANAIGPDDIVWIDSFSDKDLARILNGEPGVAQSSGWLPAYAQSNKAKRNWSRVISGTGSVVWDEFFAPIHARLGKLAIPPGAPLALLPAAGLSILPLHACWRKENGVTKYLAEDYTISYCPSAMALASTSQKLLRRQRDPTEASNSLLVVANPTGDLPFATVEGDAIAALGEPSRTQLLSGPEASWSEVGRQFKDRDYIHFACHGRYDPRYPMRSFLALAPPPERPGVSGFLRLQELMVTWDNATRLVTLSACETGVADIAHAPSEFTGLSSGWLRTGAIAVISSLWLVDDLCTMLLMERLYQGLVLSANRQASSVEPRPDAALRAAQLWLKELTCGEVSKRLAALQQQPGLTSELHDMISLRHEEFSSQPSSRKPFSQPYWWAGFLCSGA